MITNNKKKCFHFSLNSPHINSHTNQEQRIDNRVPISCSPNTRFWKEISMPSFQVSFEFQIMCKESPGINCYKKSMIRYYPIVDVSVIFQDNGWHRKLCELLLLILVSATNLSLKASLS